MFADLTFSQKMVSNELLLAYSFCVRTREVTNRGLLDMAHLPLSRKTEDALPHVEEELTGERLGHEIPDIAQRVDLVQGDGRPRTR